MRVHAVAYAKLNLSLAVLGVRGDGFHEIDSEVQTIDLCDRLTIEFPAAKDGVTSAPDLPGENIVGRAAKALRRRKGFVQGVRVHIEKRIPAGAGLGGGSSDAAAVLRVLDRLTPPELALDELCEVGAEVGSDVPLFVHGGRLRVTGRGEQVRTYDDPVKERFVVAVPSVHCATVAIYDRWDVLGGSDEAPPRVRSRGENDLLRPALDLHRGLLTYHEAMRALGAEYWGMSGSGSSFFAAFREEGAARRAGGRLNRRFESAHVFVCRPTTTGYCLLEGP